MKIKRMNTPKAVLIFAFFVGILIFIVLNGLSVLKGLDEYKASNTPTPRQMEWDKAVTSGDVARAGSLLAAGTPVDLVILRFEPYRGVNLVYKLTAAMIAAENCDVKMLKLLIEHKAAIDSQEERLRSTPLVYAVRSGCIGAVKFLIDKGADANAFQRVYRVNDYPALYYAIQSGRLDLVKLLVSNGADVNFRNNRENWYPLAWAKGKPAIEKYLVLKGARE